MNNVTLLAATLLATVSFGLIANGATVPQGVSTPTAVVTIVEDEIEIEYLPEVVVTVIEDEIEIEYIPEG